MLLVVAAIMHPSYAVYITKLFLLCVNGRLKESGPGGRISWKRKSLKGGSVKGMRLLQEKCEVKPLICV